MRQALGVLMVFGGLVVGGCDKGGGGGTKPAPPSETAAPAPAAPMVAHVESTTMPTTAETNLTPGGALPQQPASNR